MTSDRIALDPARIRELFDLRQLGGGFEEDPYPAFHRLRESGPLHEGTVGRLIGFDGPETFFALPEPELARYRVPEVEGLYLAHQSGAHPGGLCLMAVGYNLMHILIEDGVADPGDWWYASPWYIPEEGKRAANGA